MEVLAYVLVGLAVLALAIHLIRRMIHRDKAAEAAMTPEELKRKRALERMAGDV
jgi:hypothetical protein